MAELDRIRWRCRRGLLELDLVLERFLERVYARLTPEERDVFKGLLERSDNELWDLVSGRTEPPAGPEAHLVRLLRDA
ncbi:MAG TPA: succinate dehydrogenase assembly factor 2 [Burkholderiales bacterium]|nr:succinate dehydrogenase assembly factor 2 [Burkholderiales bacterium]